jgi:hypothetical protein
MIPSESTAKVLASVTIEREESLRPDLGTHPR